MGHSSRIQNDTGRPCEAVISGYVLKLARESLGLPQERLAEYLNVDKNTIQGWETGRRPLTNTRVGKLLYIRHRLRQLGADPLLVSALQDAIEADYIIDEALQTPSSDINPSAHPLATWVLKRAFHDMLAWPLRGEPPATVRPFLEQSRRGPVPGGPLLTAGEREHFFQHLRTVTERSMAQGDAAEPHALLLRRQTYYLCTWHASTETQSWLTDMARAEQRYLQRSVGWSPAWSATRSLVVARARLGDTEPLRHFLRTAMDADDCQTANLNYYAYWVGEIPETYHSDSFMVTERPTWQGTTLLSRLLDNMLSSEKIALDIDMYVQSIWSLLHQRVSIVSENPQLAASLGQRVETILGQAQLPAPSRKQLEQIIYAARAMRAR